MTRFYTYTYLRADGSPYYVGKGKGNRAFDSHVGHHPPKDRSRIAIQFWPDEATALAYEQYQIDFWGRKDLGTGILRNLTDGGEGFSGWVLTPGARARLVANGRKVGRKRAESDGFPAHLKRITALGGKASGHKVGLATVGRMRSFLTLEALKKGGHTKNHTNRSVKKVGCPFCFPVSY